MGPRDKLKAFSADAGKLIEAVVSDPLGGAGNLLGGLKIGFERFFDNIGTNILGGLWKWLFGNIELPTLKLPETFDLAAASAPVTLRDARQQLAAGAVVLISSDGKPVGAEYLKVFKADTLVLVAPELVDAPISGPFGAAPR